MQNCTFDVIGDPDCEFLTGIINLTVGDSRGPWAGAYNTCYMLACDQYDY